MLVVCAHTVASLLLARHRQLIRSGEAATALQCLVRASQFAAAALLTEGRATGPDAPAGVDVFALGTQTPLFCTIARLLADCLIELDSLQSMSPGQSVEHAASIGGTLDELGKGAGSHPGTLLDAADRLLATVAAGAGPEPNASALAQRAVIRLRLTSRRLTGRAPAAASGAGDAPSRERLSDLSAELLRASAIDFAGQAVRARSSDPGLW